MRFALLEKTQRGVRPGLGRKALITKLKQAKKAAFNLEWRALPLPVARR